MRTCMPAAKRSSLKVELVTGSGTRMSINPGNGSDPITLSTAIFKGSGVRRVSGVARNSSSKIPRIWSQ